MSSSELKFVMSKLGVHFSDDELQEMVLEADIEVKVVKNMCRVAHLYGYFVPSKTWCPLIVQRLISQPSTCDLLILSNILKGTDPETFEECPKNIANVLQNDSVCLIVDDEYLEELLECLKALLLLFDGRSPSCIQSQLFKSAISIISLSRLIFFILIE